MITTTPATPRTVWLFNQIAAKLPPQKNASDYSCSCRVGRLLPQRATVSQADFSNFLFSKTSSSRSQKKRRKIFRRKFQQPEERQTAMAAEESFQRNSRAGRTFMYPNLSKPSEVIKHQSGFCTRIMVCNCQNLRLPCRFPLSEVINMQTLNVPEGSLNNPRLYFALVNLQKLTSLVESSKQTQLLPKPPPPPDAPLTFCGDFSALTLILAVIPT